MIEILFGFISQVDKFLWSYIATPAIILLGIFLSYKFKFPQLFKIKEIFSSFSQSFKKKSASDSKLQGVAPLRVFFTSIGGCIGIGNVVAVCTAIKIGGPGALFWIWIAAFLGTIIKYSEVYLGVKFRVKNSRGSFDGGPMYYLKKVFTSSVVPILVAVLLIIYGTEVYMFSVITDSITNNWQLNRYLVITVLLISIIYAARGGVDRVGKISSTIIPIFLVIFILMSCWVLFNNYAKLFNLLENIISSAFTGSAAMGGFAGSTMLLAMSEGIARGCYSGDIGIGYAAIIHAETNHTNPAKQARLAILGIFIDTFVVCTATTLIILATDVWQMNVPASEMVKLSLAMYFPYMNIFMPIFILLLGYSSLIAFFCVGLKCSKFLFPKWGRKFYYIFSGAAFTSFSFLQQDNALLVMSITGAILLSINLYGIYKLRHFIKVE